ncbi:aminotransferase class IV family protein [Actinomadura kijaniata]|uniref:Branched-subunit amino acid aminotransferase/4-amino-4-deoxychorismate lyase n=1 Tax=Actinomadura namibiensis TaxID=182080 RepID=A0A7W3LPF6_ACTNM|nr:aminotransferase class IV [Actinomadura namibiensis]MBA8951860.1 branched-subunit amino acid aminotransferase/4-amino-4-deoxychorismate lyase [Actinomadura namibiensis]
MAELDGEPVGVEQLAALALVNYGHFTTMRVEGGGVRGLALHLDRLTRDCRALFGVEPDVERVRRLARRAAAGAAAPVVVRVTLFDPGLDIGRPVSNGEPRVLVTARAAGERPVPGMRVGTVRYARDLPAVKHVGLFGAVRRRRDAQAEGFDDALFVDAGASVTEGTTWNVGFFDGRRVVWPDAEVLPGVTMRLLRGSVRPVGVADLAGMEAAFATNAAVGVRAITAVDGRAFPADHPVLDALRREYAAVPLDPL